MFDKLTISSLKDSFNLVKDLLIVNSAFSKWAKSKKEERRILI